MSIRALTLTPLALAALAFPTLAQAVAPVAGDIAISEIMNNPGPDACVTDNNGEYFEVTNISTKVIDLNGVFFGDGATPATGVFFVTRPVVATIPSLFPGQAVVFCRKASTLINGGVPNVVYEYAAAAGAPADNSQISSGGMNLNNGADGIHISVGGPLVIPSPNPNGYVLGTEIEFVSYDSTQAPYVAGGNGAGAERKNLFAPMVFTPGSPNVNSANLAVSTNVFKTFPALSCNATTPTNDFLVFGTPGAQNSTDTSVWPTNTSYNGVIDPNPGTLLARTPASLGGGFDLKLGNGPALTPFFLGDAADIASEIPVALFLPGNPGSFLLDLGTASYFQLGSFDATGNAAISVPIPNIPALIGLKNRQQWLALDITTFQIVQSNGLISEFTN